MDVRNPEDHEKIVKKVMNQEGQLDCYVNNAGYSKGVLPFASSP